MGTNDEDQDQDLAGQLEDMDAASASSQQQWEEVGEFNYENLNKLLRYWEENPDKLDESGNKNEKKYYENLRDFRDAFENDYKLKKDKENKENFEKFVESFSGEARIRRGFGKRPIALDYAQLQKFSRTFTISGRDLSKLWHGDRKFRMEEILTPEEFMKRSEKSLERLKGNKDGVFQQKGKGDFYRRLLQDVDIDLDKKDGRLLIDIPKGTKPAAIERSFNKDISKVEITLRRDSDQAIFLMLESNNNFPSLTLQFPKDKSGKTKTEADIIDADVEFAKKLLLAAVLRGIPVKLDPKYQAALMKHDDFETFQKNLEKTTKRSVNTDKRYLDILHNYGGVEGQIGGLGWGEGMRKEIPLSLLVKAMSADAQQSANKNQITFRAKK